MKHLLCKIFPHRWDQTFTVLTHHWPEIMSVGEVKGNRFVLHHFNYVRTCKHCGLEQANKQDILGLDYWVSIEQAKRETKEFSKRER